MKGSEIQLGKRYAAKVDYTEHVLVDVLEVGVERPRGYSGKARSDGVRVRVAAPYASWGRERPAGDERLITSRDVMYEWSVEHQERRDARDGEAKHNRQRADAIEDALIAQGIAAKVDPKSKSVRLTLDAAERLLGIESEVSA